VAVVVVLVAVIPMLHTLAEMVVLVVVVFQTLAQPMLVVLELLDKVMLVEHQIEILVVLLPVVAVRVLLDKFRLTTQVVMEIQPEAAMVVLVQQMITLVLRYHTLEAVVVVPLILVVTHMGLLVHLVFQQTVELVVTLVTLVLVVLEVQTLDKAAVVVLLDKTLAQLQMVVMVVLVFVLSDMMQRHYKENR
jgi:hypothetical protein